MGRNGTYSKDIEEYFRDNPGKIVSSGTLMKAARCNLTQVSQAISYLNHKARTGKGGISIKTVVRGAKWQYDPVVSNQPPEFQDKVTVLLPNVIKGQPAEEMRRLADKITASAPAVDFGDVTWGDVAHAARQARGMTEGWYQEVGKSHSGEPLVKDNTGKVFKVVPV